MSCGPRHARLAGGEGVDHGETLQPAHFGEMSCQFAYGCRGMLSGGNCRDTQYVLKMDDFPMYS